MERAAAMIQNSTFYKDHIRDRRIIDDGAKLVSKGASKLTEIFKDLGILQHESNMIF